MADRRRLHYLVAQAEPLREFLADKGLDLGTTASSCRSIAVMTNRRRRRNSN